MALAKDNKRTYTINVYSRASWNHLFSTHPIDARLGRCSKAQKRSEHLSASFCIRKTKTIRKEELVTVV